MRRSDRAAVTRQRLTARLDGVAADRFPPTPPAGWLRTVRESLGMSTRALGVRLGVAHTSVAGIEHAEVSGAIKLETLRRAADALDCDLVYALVPRRPLAETVWREARQRAAEDLVRSGGPPVSRDEQTVLVESRAMQRVAANKVWA